MAKRVIKSEKVVIHEHFKTLNSLVDIISDRPKHKAYQDYEKPASMRDETGEKKPWAGTQTFSEATEMIKTGFKDPLEKMKKSIVKIGNTQKPNRPKPKNDFVGYVPHVPNTVMGLPMTMINKEKQVSKNKMIHLIYSFGASSNVKPNDMIKGGINFISLVNSLEKQGYRVKIDVATTFTVTNTLAVMTVNVKEFGQKLNLLKLTFPLIQPAMFRRIAFKWIETTPENNDKDFTTGYGKPLSAVFNQDAQKEADYLRKVGVIKNSNTYFLSVYNAMKSEAPEHLAKMIGIIK
jgi:hypothetical protein